MVPASRHRRDRLPVLLQLRGLDPDGGWPAWVVYGVLVTEDAVSPSVSTATVALSLGAFMLLYTILGVVDFVLMRRYARLGPPELAPTMRQERRFRRRATDGSLEITWFAWPAVLLTGYRFEGFDFGVGMPCPCSAGARTTGERCSGRSGRSGTATSG